MRKVLLQLLALAPIPVIIALVVWASQRPLPPPAPATARVHKRVEMTLPKTMGADWQVDGEIETFNKKTLYDRINGAAPAYLKRGYRRSVGADYRKPGLADPVTVDVYDMSSAAQALSIFTAERGPEFTAVEIGAGGYLSGGSLNYCYKHYYVKIAGFEESVEVNAALTELAKALLDVLPAAKPEHK